MDQDLLSKAMAEMGRKGGHARAKSLTAKERRESAAKASKAAADARRKKAKERRDTEQQITLVTKIERKKARAGKSVQNG
jgi:hypothetical protein